MTRRYPNAVAVCACLLIEAIWALCR